MIGERPGTTKDQESLFPSKAAKHLWTWREVRKERKRKTKRFGELHDMERRDYELRLGSGN